MIIAAFINHFRKYTGDKLAGPLFHIIKMFIGHVFRHTGIRKNRL